MGHLSMFIRCMGGKKLLLWGKICGQEYPGRERSHKDFQATESPCKKKCATEHGGPRILDVSLPV